MNSLRKNIAAIGFVLTVVLGAAGLVSAQARNDREVRDAMRMMSTKLDDFESNLRYQMQSSSSSNRNLDHGADLIREMRDQMRVFQNSFDRRRESRDDVNRIVDAAIRIDDFLRTYPQNRRVTDDWTGVRRQIDRLASNYGLTPSWDDGQMPGVRDNPDNADPQVPVSQVGLSGTYTLDRARSENIDEIVAEARVSGADRDDLKEKLQSPEAVALEVRGNQVTLATTTSTPVTFTADGRDKTERDPSGRNVRTRATLTGDSLIISSVGGDTDYTITFTSVSGGQTLKVSRRITTDYLRQTAFAESVYSKTDTVARLGIDGIRTTANTTVNTTSDNTGGGYSDNDRSVGVNNGGVNTRYPDPNANRNRGGRPSAVTSRPGNYVVPNGVILSGTLNNEINTRVSQSNDRFRMTIQSPAEYQGAVIEGYISNVKNSGRVTGEAGVTFNFERITLRNGQTYDFAGKLQMVADSFGKTIKVDNEGTAQSDSQTTQTAKRGGIGAGIGAIIGAIAGGGKGAVLGAVIGGGAGAGSVIYQGREDIRLMPGSTITVQSTSPTNLQTR